MKEEVQSRVSPVATKVIIHYFYIPRHEKSMQTKSREIQIGFAFSSPTQRAGNANIDGEGVSASILLDLKIIAIFPIYVMG